MPKAPEGITPTPKGRYRVRWYNAQKKQRSKTVDTLTEARLVLSMGRSGAIREDLGLEVDSRDHLLAKDVLAQFEREKVKRLRPNTQKSYRIACANLKPLLGSVRVPQLDNPRVLKLRGELQNKGMANSTVNNNLAVLRAAFNWAVDHGIITQMPFTRFEKLKDDRKHQTPGKHARLTVDELRSLVAAAEDYDANGYGKRYPMPPGCVIIAAAETGMRIAELGALCWRSVLPDRILIEAESSKTDERSVPVSAKLAEVFARVKKAQARMTGSVPGPNDRVFLAPKGGILDPHKQSHYGNLLRRLAEKCGLPLMCPERGNTGFHSLRHTLTTHLFQADVKPQYIMRILGHKKIETTMKYADTTDIETVSAMEALRSFREAKSKDESPASHQESSDSKSLA